jgi:hypothetical protein
MVVYFVLQVQPNCWFIYGIVVSRCGPMLVNISAGNGVSS